MSRIIKRGTHGKYGTAIRQATKVPGFLAWACVGETVGCGPINEVGETWFAFGETASQALKKLHKKLDSLS